tara:strand:+ start:398 stop:853 length:456 start_codon:yes stop_codon:yes gene_type:complete
MNLMNKLTSYASLVGVIGAIGGGFYAWGEFNTRLDAIENAPSVNVAPLESKISVINDKVSSLEVDILDRITALKEQVEAGSELDLVELELAIEEVEVAISVKLDGIGTDLEAMKDTLTEMDKKVRIVEKENELQDQKIESNRLKASNPLAG